MVTVHLLFVITFPSQLTLYLIPAFSSVKPVKRGVGGGGGGEGGIAGGMGVVSIVSVCVWVGVFFFGGGGRRGRKRGI